MNRFWGDESWQQAAYTKSRQANLFSSRTIEKQANSAIVAAFRERLNKVAGFEFVPEPLPMRNSRNAVVYYLFFASPKPVARKSSPTFSKNIGAKAELAVQTPRRWHEYQEQVAEVFRAAGCDATPDVLVKGVRASHKVDVRVIFEKHGIRCLWILALLWQKFSQGYAELNHLRQCGQREGRARVM